MFRHPEHHFLIKKKKKLSGNPTPNKEGRKKKLRVKENQFPPLFFLSCPFSEQKSKKLMVPSV